MASLDMQQVSKSFGRTKALSELTLSIKDGEFLILLGPTGAGKTTTLRCVAGLEKPETGTISINRENVVGLSPAERDVAFVFQSYALYPRKTVFENMAFPLQARRLSPQEITRQVEEIASKLRITELLQRRPTELSGGQQQRVALGRAMVRRPQVFLMDEPLTNLDFKLRVEMRAELKRLQKELGATFFYVTNDQVEAMSMADRIAILDHGKLQQVDVPEDVYSRPANQFVAAFVGSPRMNFMPCSVDSSQRRLVGSGWHMVLAGDALERLSKGSGLRYVFGVRAEDVQVTREANHETIAGKVYVTEPLGDRTLLDIQLGETMMKVKVPATFVTHPGETLHLRFDAQRFHLFDQQSGETIV
ncbi:MAG: ABC transporter ATP-binding protein [Chloroflexi bacterium]|nr:ABC transporter ATP-binding protein [Chloroflexota bacterium]